MAGVAEWGHGHGATLRTTAARWSARADLAAVEHSARPAHALAVLLAAGLGLAAVGIPAGLLVHDDPALYFREGMPGTWLSAAMLLAAAVTARAAHRRERTGRWHESFWGVSAAVLLALVAVELLQPTIFLGHWLEDSVGAVAPFGFRDLDALLLVLVLAGALALLARHVLDLRGHPVALGLFAVTGALAAASQGLDAFWPVSEWEFVAEEGLKATAEPFLVAAYLVGLADIARKNNRNVG